MRDYLHELPSGMATSANRHLGQKGQFYCSPNIVSEIIQLN